MISNPVTCSQCKSNFYCRLPQKDNLCWCSNYPSIIIPDEDTHCLCESCLKKEITQKIETLLQLPDVKQLDLAKYMTEEIIEGIDYHLENGFMVFTKWFLLKRGNCCNSDCRNCPYKS